MNNTKNNKLRGAIYGLAVGDALGVPFEFMERGTFNCVDMIGNGTHNQPIGIWSDDTAMTLATCASIKKEKSIIPQKIMENFKLWLKYGDFAIDNIVFDIGNTTLKAINRGYGCDDLYSNGNGSLMRIIPLAFIEATDDDISAVSSLTHAHKISIDACKYFLKIAKRLILGDNIKNLIDSDILNLQENNIQSDGYVKNTLQAALWCVVTTNSYKECVLKAVNLGDDTDTTAAIAGGLAGIIYGYEGIPKEWISKLRGKDIIEDCLF